jgi:hypothetical protein
MPPRDLNDAKYWRDEASELRAIAESYHNASAAAPLLRLADDFDRTAERAEERAKRGIVLPTPGDSGPEKTNP